MTDQLKRLGLTQLARVLPTLLDEARVQQLSYDAFLRQALDAELVGRQQRALERRLRAAHLPRRVRLDAFDFSFQPTLSERLVRELASLRFVQTATNVVLLGPPGVGKTHLASALALAGMEACLGACVGPLSTISPTVCTPRRLASGTSTSLINAWKSTKRLCLWHCPRMCPSATLKPAIRCRAPRRV